MVRIFLAGAASTIMIAACATAPTTAPTTTDVTEVVFEDLSDFDRALTTADDLVAAGNTSIAIDRLTQELGNDTLTPEQRAILHFERGKLRLSEDGYDVFGAVEDFDTVVSSYPTSTVATEAGTLLATARGEATSLNFLIEQPETSRSQRFEALFRLGEHQEAIDLMLSTNLQPENDILVAMYQIGYLCEAEGLTGPAYGATLPDGMREQLRFCDFGK